jgi:hypothetical protein
MRRVTVILATTGTALALGACGQDRSAATRAPEPENASAATALKELGETRDGLVVAQRAYAAGDRAMAKEGVAEAYVSHFEEVEGPLGRRDGDLKERLEEAIREDLRKLIDRRAAGPVVTRALRGIYADLDRAEALLK